MCHQVKIRKSGVLTTQRFICFVWISQKTNYIPIKYFWLLDITDTESVCCTLGNESLYTIRFHECSL